MLKLTPETIYPAASMFIAAAGAVYDVRSRRVPNVLTLPAILSGLALHFALGGWRQLGASASAGAICGLIFFAFHIAGGMGAGDVKLIAAVGCVSGLPQAWNLLVLTALAGGFMAAGLALARGRMRETMVNVGALVLHHGRRGFAPHPELNLGNEQVLRLPYALAIAVGSVLSFCLSIVQR